MSVDQLAPEEQLSPESVLVLPPVLRAQAIGQLDPPSWPTSRRTVPEYVAEHPEHLAERVAEYVPEPVAERVPQRLPQRVPGYPLVEDSGNFDEPVVRSLGTAVAGRVVQLGLIFLAVTIITLAMSVVAHAIR